MFYGRVLGLQASLPYEGQSIEMLKEDFESSVEEYLEFCIENDIQPEKSVVVF